MTSSYAIRRLNEARKLSDDLAKTCVPVIRHKLTGSVPDISNRHEIWDHYELENGSPDHITISHLCNQLIHSFVWLLSASEEENLFDGVYVASEKERDKHVYFLPVASLIDLCRQVAVEDIGSIEYRRGPDGVMRIVSVKDVEPGWNPLQGKSAKSSWES